MLKSILEIKGVKSLTRNGLRTISGGTDCSIIFNACDEQHPTNDDTFESCLRYSGCGPS
ncbi:hypothetical protein [Aquimarina aquimarini]|uniref:hypothetical protein n=1 Tax=Aquimarina aquimarini TaxID=1191734 RepID=UPI00131EE7ED|nr:hypothetical protein [Aquimarina aquimarini]